MLRTRILRCSICSRDRISAVPKVAEYFTSCPPPWLTHAWKRLQMSFTLGDQHHFAASHTAEDPQLHLPGLHYTEHSSNTASHSTMCWFPASSIQLWPVPWIANVGVCLLWARRCWKSTKRYDSWQLTKKPCCGSHIGQSTEEREVKCEEKGTEYIFICYCGYLLPGFCGQPY